MEKKLLIATILFISISVLLFSQVKFVQAGGPSRHISSVPLTYPEFYIRGNVSLRVLDRFIPIPQITIRAISRGVSVVRGYATKTDFAGNYTLSLPPGFYQVEAAYEPGNPSSIYVPYIFTPTRSYINVDRILNNINFVGFIRPRGRG